MKLFIAELRKQMGRKFRIVFLIMFLFSFGISAYFSKNYAETLDFMEDILLMNAQTSLLNCEEKIQGEKDADRLQFYGTRKEAAKDRLAAYENQDTALLIDATLRYSQCQMQAAKYGILLDSRSLSEAAEAIQICSILKEKGIAVYHEPLLAEMYGNGAECTTAFMENYLFWLLPFFVVFLCADILTVELQPGSIKLLLGLAISRRDVLVSKYAAGVLSCGMVLLAGLTGAFLGGTLFSGTGDVRYPVKASDFFLLGGKEKYLAQWQVWLQIGATYLCAILFFAALSMAVGVAVGNSVWSFLTGVVLAGGAAAAGRMLINRDMIPVSVPVVCSLFLVSGGFLFFLSVLAFRRKDVT